MPSGDSAALRFYTHIETRTLNVMFWSQTNQPFRLARHARREKSAAGAAYRRRGEWAAFTTQIGDRRGGWRRAHWKSVNPGDLAAIAEVHDLRPVRRTARIDVAFDDELRVHLDALADRLGSNRQELVYLSAKRILRVSRRHRKPGARRDVPRPAGRRGSNALSGYAGEGARSIEVESSVDECVACVDRAPSLAPAAVTSACELPWSCV
ncbi:hypothetical protein OPAG_06778 [Rhodococcus opacus PD630]|nr:hypothetical protein Pd630_LPD15041 [Rhodococcus opacus PD630]EHI43499.1 hypothetical protein OPAG_06778 [Rhodococcus opacus PD630]